MCWRENFTSLDLTTNENVSSNIKLNATPRFRNSVEWCKYFHKKCQKVCLSRNLLMLSILIKLEIYLNF